MSRIQVREEKGNGIWIKVMVKIGKNEVGSNVIQLRWNKIRKKFKENLQQNNILELKGKE